ncbi:MAG: NADH-quinone oxidoreductase subunit I [Methanonatronarchaeales archaeon]|nr:NADH-quinone oxidoreductase subunit I [Methanonatronarchaeales archaeon]
MLRGMATVARHVFRPLFTEQYPEKQLELPEIERGRLLFLEERCIKCRQCERICPNGTISMEVERDLKSETGEKLILREYNVHQGSCLVCDLCVEVCPTDTLAWATVYEAPTFKREDLFFDRERLAWETDRVSLDRIAESTFYERDDYVEAVRASREGER